MNTTENGRPLGIGLSEGFGPLPKPTVSTAYHQDGWGIPAYTAEEVHACVAKEVAAERERWFDALRTMRRNYEQVSVRNALNDVCFCAVGDGAAYRA